MGAMPPVDSQASPAAATGVRGCSFLTTKPEAASIFTAEDLSSEHLSIARTTDEFFAKDVEPELEAIRHQDHAAARRVLRKASALGLTAMQFPERFGGLELDLASVMLVAEHLAVDASYGGWHSAHTGIGSLPLLYFGNEAQKQKYLPKLASVEMLAAYALTEPQAGSDSLGARTRADLNPEGTHYILNGQKMWITNGGAADLYTVFAKVGGEKFTAFLVERAFPGVSTGAEEQKMGIKGTSTTAVYFDNVPVPVENVLGEIGRGHIIAFNILNVGRMKLGAATTGAGKDVLKTCLKYAKQRRAFGSSIAEFGAIQHKLAEMAIRIYAGESMLWRNAGNIENAMPAMTELQAVEEFAAECSMIKVCCSEALSYVVDEGVQIHGGYGFHQHYAVERAYRDSRINRLFEGTSEINRIVISSLPFKRAERGQNDLLTAACDVDTTPTDDVVENAKRAFLFTVTQADRNQQEMAMNLADMMIEIFAMESAMLRAKKRPSAMDMATVFARDSLARIENAARNILGTCAPDAFPIIRKLTEMPLIDSIGLRRRIARRLLDREAYVV
jgi:alkylation response protein AidB-like acyl-CoA dehydrogenase